MPATLPAPAPLVLIPALLCDDALFRHVVADLGGRVAADVVVASRPTLAENVADVLARAPDRFVLGGASYGGIVALEVALAAPERVAALWLTGSDPGAPDRVASLGLAGMLEGAPDGAVPYLAGRVVRPEATAAAATFTAMAGRVGGAAGGAQMRTLAGREAAWDRLDRLTMPTLVLWGADDALVPVDVGRRLAGALPHAQLHVLGGRGHLPMLEAPSEVAALVGAWLDAEVLRG